MLIETKYNVGDHIWVVYEHKGEVCVFDDYIGWISFENELLYGTKEACEELRENEVILYEDEKKLIERIKALMNEIRYKENDNQEVY